jgi:replicative DNA helicase
MLPMSVVVDSTLDKMQTLAKKSPEEQLLGVTTGSQHLDQHTSGFAAGDLIIVAGRPSMGKTTFAMNTVFAVAKTQPVAVFSMEMPRHQLAQRLLSSTSSINSDKIRQPWDINASEWVQLKHHAEQLKQRNIFMDASSSLKVADIRSRCRRLIRRLEKKFNGLGLIVIDYLQLMTASESKSNRNAEISEITRELKRTALEFNVPIVLLSQLSREVDKRPNKRPIMSDLRDSGAIEQDADMILFLYRDEIYHPNKSENKGKAEIIIRKFRNGQTGTIQQQFQGEYARFRDLDPAQHSQNSPTTPRQDKAYPSFPANQTIVKPTSTQSVRRSARHKEVF